MQRKASGDLVKLLGLMGKVVLGWIKKAVWFTVAWPWLIFSDKYDTWFKNRSDTGEAVLTKLLFACLLLAVFDLFPAIILWRIIKPDCVPGAVWCYLAIFRIFQSVIIVIFCKARKMLMQQKKTIT